MPHYHVGKIKEAFAGGAYGKRQEERIKKTTQGRATLEKIERFKSKPLREKLMSAGGYLLRRRK